MFKKTLLATALMAVGFNAMAASVAASGDTISVEGTATGSAVPLAAVVTSQLVTASATYSSFSGVSIELSGASFNPATSLTLTVDDASGNANATTPGTPDVLTAAGDFAVTFTSASRAQIVLSTAGLNKLDLSAAGVADAAQTATFSVGGIVINDADVVAGTKITASVELDSNIPGTDIEVAAGQIAIGVQQFKGAAVAHTKDINVSKGRTEWVDDAKVASFVTKIDGVLSNVRAADASSKVATVTLTGDFSWLDADSNGKIDDGVSLAASGTLGTTSAVVFATDFQSASTKLTLSATTLDGLAAESALVTWTLTTDGVRQIPTGAITSSTSMPYIVTGTSNGTFTASNTVANWGLNGDTATISFLPFGPGYSQSVTVTNTGTVDGAMSVDWFFNGTKVTLPLVATATPNSVTDISDELKAQAAANGIVGAASLSIVTNSPSGQISVDALFYSFNDKDRGVVLSGGKNTD